MVESRTSLFDGLSAEQRAQIQGSLQRRHFPAGATMLAEGDAPGYMYVVLSGTADVTVAARGGRRQLARHGPGATVGEMSLLSGQPVSATVRTTSELEALILSDADFRRVAAAFPRVSANIGTMLAERLARTNRLISREDQPRIALLHDLGAPPLLGYALACSVAWHTRSPTALLYVGEGDPPAELTTLSEAAGGTAAQPGTRLMLLRCSEPGEVERALEQATAEFTYVLVQARRELRLAGHEVRHLQLAGADGSGVFLGERPGHTLLAWAPTRAHRPDREGVLHISPLVAADEEALTGGLLPARTVAGRALGWAARDLTGHKVGLALGGGASKGYAHIGVMEVLRRAGLDVDYLTGTSIGSAVAALWASGHSPDSAAQVLDEIGKSAFRPVLPRWALLSDRGLRAGILRQVGQTRIEDLHIPLGVVAADIITREQVVLRRGLLGPAVLASMSIPGIYPPRRYGPHMLVDGGILNPVPSNVAAEMGADVVVAVKLGNQPRTAAEEDESPRTPSIFQAITRSIETMQGKIVTDTASAATIVIEPELSDASGWGLRRFSEGRRFIAEGAAAAEAALPRLAAALPWLR